MTSARIEDRALLDTLDTDDASLAATRLALGVDPGARSLARRDAALLRLHLERYGPSLRAAGECPACGETLEVELPVDGLLPDDTPVPQRVTAAGHVVTYRLPEPSDLDAAIDERDLAVRCVRSATRLGDGVAVAPAALPDAVLLAMGEAMAAGHPAGGLAPLVSCGSCGAAWEAPLDVAGLVAARARVDALRIVAEVHALASAYGWTEAEALAVPRARRRRYLELIGA